MTDSKTLWNAFISLALVLTAPIWLAVYQIAYPFAFPALLLWWGACRLVRLAGLKS